MADDPEALVLELVSGAGHKVHLQREKALARLEESLMRNAGEAGASDQERKGASSLRLR